MSAVARFNPSTEVATDVALLLDVAAGDSGALGILFDRHHACVRRVLRRAGVSSADVDDVIQATFLELPRIASSFDGRCGSCASWLCGIALRLAARQRRSLGRFLRMLVSFGRATEDASAVTPEEVAAGRQDLGRFADALSGLAPKKREAFVMIELEGFTAELVAQALGENAATIRTRLFHARNELRAAVEKD